MVVWEFCRTLEEDPSRTEFFIRPLFDNVMYQYLLHHPTVVGRTDRGKSELIWGRSLNGSGHGTLRMRVTQTHGILPHSLGKPAVQKKNGVGSRHEKVGEDILAL